MYPAFEPVVDVLGGTLVADDHWHPAKGTREAKVRVSRSREADGRGGELINVVAGRERRLGSRQGDGQRGGGVRPRGGLIEAATLGEGHGERAVEGIASA